MYNARPSSLSVLILITIVILVGPIACDGNGSTGVSDAGDSSDGSTEVSDAGDSSDGSTEVGEAGDSSDGSTLDSNDDGQTENRLEVELTFPTPNSFLGGANELSVSGRIHDTGDGTVSSDEVSSIDVNGNTVTPNMNDPSFWSLSSLPLVKAPGITIEAMVESVTGDTSSDVHQVDNQVALDFSKGVTIDADRNRALILDINVKGVVAVDLANGQRSILSDADKGAGPDIKNPTAIAMDETNDRLLVTDGDAGPQDSGAVIAVDPNSGDRSLFSAENNGNGPKLRLPKAITVDAANDRALVVEFTSGGRIFEIDLATGDRQILSDNDGNGSGPNFDDPNAIAVDAGNGRALVPDSGLEAVVAVDLGSGDRTIFSDANNGAGPDFRLDILRDIAMDESNGRALLIKREGQDTKLVSLDLANGDRQRFSDKFTGNGPFFGDLAGLAIDSANGRVVVADRGSWVSGVLAVDLTSGDRTGLSVPETGTGPPFEFPESVVIDENNERALVADGRFGGVLEVDLTTGARTVVSDINSSQGVGPAFDEPSGIALDRPNNRVLIADRRDDVVVGVELASGDRTILSGDGTGSGPAFSSLESLVFREGENTVLVVDSDLNALLEVDLGSGDRSIVSDASVGSGPPLSSPKSLVVDDASGSAWVVGSDPKVVSVNLNSGDRSVVSDSGRNIGAGPEFLSPASIFVDQPNDRAIVVTATRLVAVDLSSGDRTRISDTSNGNGPRFSRLTSIAFDSENSRAIVTDGWRRAAFLANFSPGAPNDRVILSQ